MYKNKKILFIVISILILIVIIGVFIFLRLKNKNSSDVLFSSNQELSIEIPKKLKLEQIQNPNYILYLQSNNLRIRVSKINRFLNKSLEKIIEADKETYLKNFQNYNNVSDIIHLEINGYNSYMYTFDFTTTSPNIILSSKNIAIEQNDVIYMIDFTVNSAFIQNSNEIINEILLSLKIY